MFARDSQTLRNKCYFVISVIAINVFYCIYLLPLHSAPWLSQDKIKSSISGFKKQLHNAPAQSYFSIIANF